MLAALLLPSCHRSLLSLDGREEASIIKSERMIDGECETQGETNETRERSTVSHIILFLYFSYFLNVNL